MPNPKLLFYNLVLGIQKELSLFLQYYEKADAEQIFYCGKN